MNSDARLYDETTDSDEEDISDEYPDRTPSTRSQLNELFLHLTDGLARAGKRDPARAEITGDTPSVEKIIARDVNHFNDMLPPYVRTRKSWTKSRSAFLCDEANKVTTQEITIEPREYQKGYIYLVAVVQDREYLLNAYKGGSGGGCYYRVWLGHQHGEDQAIFARSKVTPNHHRQNALHNERTESSPSEYLGHLEGSNETPEMATRKSDFLTPTIRKPKCVRTTHGENAIPVRTSGPQTTSQAHNGPQHSRRNFHTTAGENSIRQREPAPLRPSQSSTPVPQSSMRPSMEYYLERSIQLKMDRLDRIAEKRQLTEAGLDEQYLLADQMYNIINSKPRV
ncbi:MAG: hypothetical protein Q9177_001075 [Variospora cf. flavescens]